MPSGVHIFRKFDDGDILLIAWRADINEAEELIKKFNEDWPGDYGTRAEGSQEPISWSVGE